MKHPLISAILYLSDGADYIRGMISSLKAQTLTSFECIVVEDGVQDRSVLKALHAIGHDPRFRLIHSDKRLGPGASRNRALLKAQGAYVFFPSQEDALDTNYFKEVSAAFQNSPDMVITGLTHSLFNHKNEFLHTVSASHKKEMCEPPSAELLLSLNKAHLFAPLYNKFINRDFLGSTTFETTGDKTSEDFFFELTLFSRARSVTCVKTAGYHFLHHVSREAQLEKTHESFIARHRRVAALYEWLDARDELSSQHLSELQAMYEEFILDELVRMTSPFSHATGAEKCAWVEFLKEDPLFITLVKEGVMPHGFFNKRFHSSLLAKSPKAALRLAHAVEYARSFGPKNRTREEK